MPAEQVRDLDLDLIIFQSPKNYFEDQYEILSPEQLKLPKIYLEHNAPRPHPTDTRHPVDDPNVLLVHVTHYTWERQLINNAANPLYLERNLVHSGEVVRYKVAWVGGANVLFDREKLQSVGAFSWWRRLPPEHAGEEVVAQFLLLHKYGGCGILPSGTYHLCLPTMIEDRRHNATELYAELLEEITHERLHP